MLITELLPPQLDGIDSYSCLEAKSRSSHIYSDENKLLHRKVMKKSLLSFQDKHCPQFNIFNFFRFNPLLLSRFKTQVVGLNRNVAKIDRHDLWAVILRFVYSKLFLHFSAWRQSKETNEQLRRSL